MPLPQRSLVEISPSRGKTPQRAESRTGGQHAVLEPGRGSRV